MLADRAVGDARAELAGDLGPDRAQALAEARDEAGDAADQHRRAQALVPLLAGGEVGDDLAAPELIAPMIAPATTSTARPEPNVAITNAVRATATIRLTQKPGSVSSLATNSNAALSFSATHLAAETILPHRPPGFLGSSLDAGVDLRLALGDLARVVAGDLGRAALDLGLVGGHLGLGLVQTLRELALDLVLGGLDLARVVRDGLVARGRGGLRGALDLRADVGREAGRAGLRAGRGLACGGGRPGGARRRARSWPAWPRRRWRSPRAWRSCRRRRSRARSCP